MAISTVVVSVTGLSVASMLPFLGFKLYGSKGIYAINPACTYLKLTQSGSFSVRRKSGNHPPSTPV